MLSRNPSQNGLPADQEPADDGLEQTPVEPATTAAGAGRVSPQITRKEAVRLALDAGHDNTKEAIPWIKDEFNLDIRVRYQGAPLVIPERRPTPREIVASEDGERLLAGYLLRRSADRITCKVSGGEAEVQLHYDH